MSRIYLAGPITGCTFAGCTDWREAFAKYLTAGNVGDKFDLNKVVCLSPMRGKDYILELTNDSEGRVEDSYPNHVLSCDRGIMTRDYNDCTTSDVVIANLLGAERVSIGTVMEVAWAYQSRIPVIAVIEPSKNLHDHSMMREAFGFRVTTLEEAAQIALTILWPVARYDSSIRLGHQERAA